MENLKKAMIIRNGNVVGAIGDKYFSTAPIGTVLAYAGNEAPRGYLLANGASYAVADYPDLYAVIGNTYGGDSTNFNVPDYRETVLVGVGENTTDTISSHDVYELGEFKDDQLQQHKHVYGNGFLKLKDSAGWSSNSAYSGSGNVQETMSVQDVLNARSGTTTHGKQKGVTYIIKAFHTNEGVDSGVSDDVINYVEGEIAEVDTELNAKLNGKADKNAVLKSLEVGSGNIAAQIIPWNDGIHYRGFEDKSSNTYTDIITKDGIATIAKVENGTLTKIEEIATMDKVVPQVIIENKTTDDARTIIQNSWGAFPTNNSLAKIETSIFTWSAQIYKLDSSWGTIILTCYADNKDSYIGKLSNKAWHWYKMGLTEV